MFKGKHYSKFEFCFRLIRCARRRLGECSSRVSRTVFRSLTSSYVVNWKFRIAGTIGGGGKLQTSDVLCQIGRVFKKLCEDGSSHCAVHNYLHKK